jgi:hypothetical protein
LLLRTGAAACKNYKKYIWSLYEDFIGG